MKPALTRCHLFLAMTAVLFLGATPTAICQTEENIPRIKFNDMPITTAIEHFARRLNLNYMIDPKLFTPPGGSNPRGIPEPSLSIDWTNMTATDALTVILKAYGLIMVQDKVTTVTLITDTNHVAHVVDASLLVSTNTAAHLTNGLIPVIHFWDVPLDAALKNLIAQGQIRVVVDPNLAAAGWSRRQLHIFLASVNWGEVVTVRIHWQNLTAQQAIVALCEGYNLVIVKDAATGVVIIKPGN